MPLLALTPRRPVLLIIDGLDECKGGNSAEVILEAFVPYVKEISLLKVLISSRSTHSTNIAFSSEVLKENHHSFVLHSMDTGVVDADIRLYLRIRLQNIAARRALRDADWPSDTYLDKLVRKSGQLFVFASTICTYVEAPGDVDYRLRTIADRLTTDVEGQIGIDGLYHDVTQVAIQRLPDHQSLRECLVILGVILHAQNAMCAQDLSELLGFPPAHILGLLTDFAAVLTIPESTTQTIRILHASFYEYMTDRRRVQPVLYLHPPTHHYHLAIVTLQSLVRSLKRNVADLDRFVLDDEVEDIEERVARYIPETELTDEIFPLLYTFVHTRLLVWIETLSVMSSLEFAIPALEKAVQWLRALSSPPVGIAEILEDALRCALEFYTCIETAGAQIFYSALLFVPLRSRIREIYEAQQSKDIRIINGLEEDWSPTAFTLNHNSEVLCVASSPDGRCIATSMWKGDVVVWNAENGQMLASLHQGDGPTVAVSFFQHGDHVLTESDTMARVWNPDSANELGSFDMPALREEALLVQPHKNALHACAVHAQQLGIFNDYVREYEEAERANTRLAVYAHERLVFLIDQDMFVKDIESNQVVCKLHECNPREAVSLAISPDGRYIVMGTTRHSIKIWSADTGKRMHALTGPLGWVLAVCISPDSKHVASADNRIRIWNVETGELRMVFYGHSAQINTLAFSPDGRRVISGSNDRSARVWELDRGALPRTHAGHSEWVQSIDFSPDGKNVASASWDGTVALWDADTGAMLKTISRHPKPTYFVGYSDDGRYILSWSGDIAEVWNVEKGEAEAFVEEKHGNMDDYGYNYGGKDALLTVTEDGWVVDDEGKRPVVTPNGFNVPWSLKDIANMPLDKDPSIVADSTISSPSSFTDIETPAIKRATFTYGRRPRPAPDTIPSAPSSASSSDSRGSTYKTALHHQDEEIPPSSEPSRWPSDSEAAADEDSEGMEGTKFEYSWKKRLREMDEEDFDMAPIADAVQQNGKPTVNMPLSSSQKAGLGESFSSSPMPFNINIDLDESGKPSVDGAATELSPKPPIHLELTPPSSPLTGTAHRTQKRTASRKSNSGSERSRSPSRNSPPSAPTASDEDVHGRILVSPSKGKGKGKVTSRSIPAPDLSGEDLSSIPRKSLSKPRRQGKTKAPTKKELAETAKARLRIAAEQDVVIPRFQTTDKYSISSFLNSLAAPKNNPSNDLSSDPIQLFSSSPTREDVQTVAPIQPNGPSHPPPQQVADIFGAPSSLLDPLVSVSVAQNENSRVSQAWSDVDRQKRAAELMELKRRAAAMQAAKRVDEHQYESDADDLEVITSPKKEVRLINEEEARRSAEKQRVSQVRKRQLQLGGVGLPTLVNDGSPKATKDLSVLLKGVPTKKKRGEGLITQAELNQAFMRKIKEDSLNLTRQKEEEWVRRGGKLAKGSSQQKHHDPQEALKIYAEEGLKAVERQPTLAHDDAEDQEDEDEDEDEDFDTALRGSASPEPGEDKDEMVTDGEDEQVRSNESEDDEVLVGDEAEEEVTRPTRRSRTAIRVESDSELDDGENKTPAPVPAAHRLAQQSDNDNGGMMLPPMQIPQRAHRTSFSSIASYEPTEDDGDKENDHSLAYDSNDDKENQAVTQQSAPLPTSPFRDASLSPTPRGKTLKDGEAIGLSSGKKRNPFKGMEDGKASQPNPSPHSPFSSRLRRLSSDQSLASPNSPPLKTEPLQPSPTIKPLLGSKGKAKPMGFSQFSDDEDLAFTELPVRGGLSQLFEADTEQPRPTPPKVLCKGGKSNLGLTQDVELDAALQVGDDLLQKADAIFEREQEEILAAAAKKLTNKPELYVNELGFLTQTRPDVSSPEIYQLTSPSFASLRSRNVSLTTNGSSSSGRQPLRTISLTQIEFDSESPSQVPLRRLRRIDESPTLAASNRNGRLPSRSPSPLFNASARKQKQPLNAFDVLGRKEKGRDETVKRRLEKSEFVEAEAEESDEENRFGFGLGVKKGDDEEDGEDLDKTLEELVDDQAMDETTLAAERVIEKFKEQEEQEDQEIEKLHQAAVHGELRRKRRNNGLGLDDSDDDSDEDERNRRIRSKMYKKQKIDRDNIKALGESEETKSFYKVYEHDLMDDDMELEYLRQPEQDVVMDNANQSTQEEHNSQAVDDEEEEERFNSEKYITRDEIVRRVRELGQQPQDENEEPLNPHDVSWIDDDMSADDTEGPHVRIKEMPTNRPGRRFINGRDSGLARQQGIETESPADLIGRPGVSADDVEEERNRARLQSWAKAESRSRVAGTTGRSVGGAAITGHVTAQSRAKQGGGSFHSGPAKSSTQDADEKPQSRPLKAMPSVLAGVSDRSNRFA
ncbi:hypothetical protein AX16_000194 [Volvariella volvacea WC 439]|nr:hypothetical protein AX16_000194 [Volvariella volvacea WC 439]